MIKAQQKIVDHFNAKVNVGDKCRVLLDSGEEIEATVCNKATLLGGHTAVAWFEEISGCYNIARVKF